MVSAHFLNELFFFIFICTLICEYFVIIT
jgi:hypothetical protein